MTQRITGNFYHQTSQYVDNTYIDVDHSPPAVINYILCMQLLVISR